jgi:hypothetical protein
MLVDDLQNLVDVHVVDVASASCAVGGLDDLAAMRGLLDRLEAAWVLAVGVADGRGDLDAGGLNASEWLALNCRRSMGEARSVLRFAKRLSYTDEVREEFVNGGLSAQQAHIFVRGLTKKHVGLFAEHEPMLVASAENLNVAQLEQLMTHWHRRADDTTADIEDRVGEAGREVFLSPIGNAWALKGNLTAEQGELVNTALMAVMQDEWDGADDQRTTAQRRSDALASICGLMLNTNTKTTTHGSRPHVEVHVDAEDLIALASVSEPSHKAKYGGFTPTGMWISGVTLERMCCDAVINQITDQVGAVSTGRVTRVIPPHRRRQVVTRDQHCRYPGCHRPAAWSEVHHVHYWQHGGTHQLENLVLLCARHHHRVHNHNETLTLHGDGRLDVTGIDGITRTSHPPPKLKHVLRKQTRANTKRHRAQQHKRAHQQHVQQQIEQQFEQTIAQLFPTNTQERNNDELPENETVINEPKPNQPVTHEPTASETAIARKALAAIAVLKARFAA